MSLRTMLVLAMSVSALPQDRLAGNGGEALYSKRCAACHDAGGSRVPDRAALRNMSSENVRFALLSGKMQFQGSALNSGEIRTISEFVTGKALHTATFAAHAYCSADASAWKADSESPHWNGWGAGVAQHRFQPAAMAGLSVGEIPRLKLKWAFGFPGDSRAFAQPTVVGGHVFVGSQGRRVYSLDAQTGCIQWVFESDFPVRSAITIDAIRATAVAFFGDQHANVYAVNARTGTLVWKTRIEEHPAAVITGAPVLAQGRLYVPVSSFEEVIGADPAYSCCKFRGS